MNNIFIYLLFLAVLHDSTNAQCDPGWFPYKDQKCIRVTDQLLDYALAEEVCAGEVTNSSFPSSLLTIKTPKEQEAIQEYLFLTVGVANSVWLGAQRKGNDTSFTWQNGETLAETFSNWGEGNPLPEDNRRCIEMRSSFKKQAYPEGRWFNEPCTPKRNLVICENLPSITTQDLKLQLNEAMRGLERFKDEIAVLRQQVDLIIHPPTTPPSTTTTPIMDIL